MPPVISVSKRVLAGCLVVLVALVAYAVYRGLRHSPIGPDAVHRQDLLLGQHKRDALLLFVHGLGGDAEATWVASNGSRFPDLVREDADLSKQFDVGVFDYPTGLAAPFLPLVEQLADGLRTELEVKYSAYERIVIVAHSLGGLVVRKYLVDTLEQGRGTKVDQVLLFAVPNVGSHVASLVGRVPFLAGQVGQLSMTSGFIDDLNKRWVRMDVDNVVRVLYVAAGRDELVPVGSSHPVWEPFARTNLDENHVGIVKPNDASHRSFHILKSFVDRSHRGYIAVDFTHGQAAWTGLDRGLDVLRRGGATLRPLQGQIREQLEELDRASVLILPLPRKARLSGGLIRYLDRWVAEGRGLLLAADYGAERHHENNINELAARFGIEFGDNMLLPNDTYTYGMASGARFDPINAVSIPTGISSHPLFEEVDSLEVLVAASVAARPEFAVVTLGAIEPSRFYDIGYHVRAGVESPAHRDIRPGRTGSAPVVAATCHGRGRVVSMGTWRMIANTSDGNIRFIRNALSWLGQEGSCNTGPI